MHKEAREELRIRFKLVVLEIADQKGAIKTCKEFNVPRATFYRWKKKYAQEGRSIIPAPDTIINVKYPQEKTAFTNFEFGIKKGVR